MNINKYPDGSSYVNGIGIGLHNSSFKVNSYEDLWHLNQAVDAYYNYFKTRPTITIPCLIDAQADRRFNYDESSGLNLVCTFLNKMQANFKIFHPHNPEVLEALIDNIEIIDNSEFINHVIYNEIYPSFDKETKKEFYKNNEDLENNLILMSSDAGGFKPLMKLCDEINWKGETFSASKARMKNGTIFQQIDCSDFDGKDILIIDDISVYGGTFKGLAKLLRERNCGKLYLAVSHMTVRNLGNDPVTNYFDKVFTTNSKYDEYYIASNKGEQTNPKNLEIVKLF
jgi:ribose-phosphate pyrophosphokinase